MQEKESFLAHIPEEEALLSHLTDKMQQGWLPRTAFLTPHGSYSPENSLIFSQLSSFNLILKIRSVKKHLHFYQAPGDRL